MTDSLAILIAALCGALAYHAHFTARRLTAAMTAIVDRNEAAELAIVRLQGEGKSAAARLHALDRDAQALCANTGVKRYSDRA